MQTSVAIFLLKLTLWKFCWGFHAPKHSVQISLNILYNFPSWVYILEVAFSQSFWIMSSFLQCISWSNPYNLISVCALLFFSFSHFTVEQFLRHFIVLHPDQLNIVQPALKVQRVYTGRLATIEHTIVTPAHLTADT